MKFDSDVLAGVRVEAKRMGIETAALLAVVQVESGGRSLMEGLCPMRIEGHYFYKRLGGAKLGIATSQRLASKSAGVVKNPRSMKARYVKLERMIAIDRQAALESCSWGVGQVMGSHWKKLGYRSAYEMVELCKSGVLGQIQVMVRYIEKFNLVEHLKNRKWAKFAYAYNGPNYKEYKYQTKLANAYRNFSGARKKKVAPKPSEYVRDLQTMLCKAGYQTAIDGLSGSHTDVMIRKFQSDHGLNADGICGDKTMAALKKTAQPDNKPEALSEPTVKPSKQPVEKQSSKTGIIAALLAFLVPMVAWFWDKIEMLF